MFQGCGKVEDYHIQMFLAKITQIHKWLHILKINMFFTKLTIYGDNENC